MNVDIMKELKGLAVKTVIEGSVSNLSVHEEQSVVKVRYLCTSEAITMKYNLML